MTRRQPTARGNWLEKNLGCKVTVEGRATNRKTGAHLSSAHCGIYIESLNAWPEGYDSRNVLVKGLLIKLYDLPVFEATPGGGIPPAGIPVAPGTNLHEAAMRYLLSNATWKLRD